MSAAQRARKSGRKFTGTHSLCRFPARFRQKVYTGVKFRSDTRQKTAKTLHECVQKARTESAEPEEAAETLQRCKEKVGYAPKNGRNFTGARSLCRLRSKKRQKLYSGVKKKSATRNKTAESLQRSEQKVRTESAEQEEATETVQRCKEKAGYAAKSGRKFTRE
ncbi:hypothetical protein ACMZ7Q_02155 [Gardnerella vaginalis]|uniref:hypothetical protein n=1 Tax=Gardnerella vaginalis TaxID=2702 RepID=UPI0039F01599